MLLQGEHVLHDRRAVNLTEKSGNATHQLVRINGRVIGTALAA
jgi:hypothetical protein